MHALTIRFHGKLWADFSREARRRKTPYSEFVREAVSFYLGYQAGEHGRGELERRVAALDARMNVIAGHLLREQRSTPSEHP